ncbi:hypothetical protein LIER_40005 [Lithospermum erythrorhizon]|uniref:Uncharacterized protein n=1 Tax=Lithospermum erythrorhizon TaxID=34254 RepID=A0AAV3QTZ9_LITER
MSRDKKWPNELPPFLEVCLDLNNHKDRGLIRKKKKIILSLRLNCLMERIGFLQIVWDAPSGTQDRRPTKIVTSRFYNFKNGFPISLPLIASGPPLGRIVFIGKSSVRNQKLTSYNGRMLCNKWEIGKASPEYLAQIDLIRGIGSLLGNVNVDAKDEGDGNEIRGANVSGENIAHRKDSRAEDYGFHHPSSGDVDGGMGLFLGGSS